MLRSEFRKHPSNMGHIVIHIYS